MRVLAFRRFAIAAALALICIDVSAADRYPERPVRLVVPFAAGGNTDIFARALGQRLSERWGQQVVVDNRGGAGGTIGTDIVAKSAPDGYTLLMVSGSHAVNRSLYHKLPYDSVKDFAPVTLVVDVPSVLVAHPSLRLQSVSDLVALAKERGGKLNYGSSGTGTFAHLAFEMFNRMAGITIEHVPYKGNAPAMADLLGGQVQAMISAQPAAMPHVRAGKLAALGVTSGKRSPQLPDVPAIGELLHGYEFNQGFGILAPAGMPAARIDRVQRDIVHVLNTPAIQKLFSTQGAVPVGSTPQEYGRYLRTEMAKLAEVVRMSGARAQ